MKTLGLKQSLSFPVLVLYGLGTMVGGGIYALIGKVAGEAGFFTPLSFLISAFIGLMTALSYAELSSRYPVSAGESRYVYEAFQQSWLSQLVGWAVILTGLVSTATLTKAGAGFFFDLINLPLSFGVLIVLLILLLFALWGIAQSALMVAIISFVEVVGLIAVIVSAVMTTPFSVLSGYAEQITYAWHGWESFSFVLIGGFLAFYAFIGFEDMVNVAEETKNASTTLPKAIITAFVITTILYLCVAIIGVTTVDLETLKNSHTPLAVIASNQSFLTPQTVGVISLIAGVNGALVQIIMVSRVLYGMARDGRATKIFAKIHARTQTPVIATLFAALMVGLVALSFDVKSLASITSAIILVVFVFVNGALIVIKNKKSANFYSVPLIVPISGLILCAGLFIFRLITIS